MTNVLAWMTEPEPRRGIHFCQPDGWELHSYVQIASDSKRMATLFLASGASGGTVSLQIQDPRVFVPAFFGTLYAGLTPVPVALPTTFASEDEYASHAAPILQAAAPTVIIADRPMAQAARAAADRASMAPRLIILDPAALPDPDPYGHRAAEIALLQFTSGSSGTPKGVRVTAPNLAANVAAIHHWLGVTSADSCSSWLPLYHDMGLIGAFLCSVVAQIDLWLMTPLDFIRSPARWLECHGKQAVTITTAPSFGYGYAASKVREDDLAGFDFSNWRIAMNGAERVDIGVAAKFASRFASLGFHPTTFVPCYGMAEATLAVCGTTPAAGARTVRVSAPLRVGEPVTISNKGYLGVGAPADPARWLSSCGPPVQATEVEILDEQGTTLPDGYFGEIAVTGPGVADGYQRPAPDTTVSFPGRRFRTGDAGFLLDSELYVVGRIGDSLKVRGRKVHAEDLEAALAAIPGIGAGRCAVALGTWQGQDRAFVLVESGSDAWLDDASGVLSAALGDSVAVTVLRARRGAIPRTSSGKPQRRTIWQRACDDTLAAEAVKGHRDQGCRAAGERKDASR